ncbi:hypothetical protein JZ751_018534 [Albula glossodonta]|uniref:AT-rich interactive domain-containing protein 5B n=1 Tax=Albula glossodonta TaxID=121402 RepID=A0A8T2NW43_9TELE|nr:hypothetical protein JZ751_018534 [Albula glossodonta]
MCSANGDYAGYCKMLILPYERFIKGEEDRPLPPVKPRRPEPGAPEGDSRIKVPAGKRPRVTQNHKNLLETDMLVKSLKPLPVSGNKEENPESPANSSGDSQPPLQQVKEERQKRDMEEEELQLTVKEETLCPNTSEDKPAPRAIPLENGTIGRLSRDPICPLPQGYPETPAHPLSLLEEDPAPGVAPKSLHYSHMQDQWQNGMPDDGTPCSVVKVDQSVAKEAQNQVGLVLPTLKQRLPLQAPRDPEVLQDEEESIFNYKPGVGMHSGSNAGIMSPLAKKKLLSQFSGGASPNNYSFAPPPAFVQAKYIAKDLPGPLGSLAPVAEATVINRPSVIQHAQSFKPRVAEERQKQEVTTQATSDVDPYLQRIDLPQGKGVEKRASSHPPQRPNFLSGFYSAHHLHSLYQQVEHCLSREQLAKYLSRESPFPQRDGSCFTSNQHPDRTGYHPTSGEDEKPPSGEVMSDDQPTDLSLPKSTPHKLSSPKPVLFGLAHTPVHHDVSQPSLFQNSTPDYHPKACRVPPMTFSAPRKPLEPPPFVRKAQDGRGECVAPGPQAAVGSVCEERARPILSTKPGPQNVGAARPLRRALEELENGPPEKKIRAVTPMHPARDARTPDVEAEGVKPADPAHVEGYTTEGHKFPLHAPMFPGLYPGGLVSQVQEVCDSLGSPVPPGYAHPLQYLKNQAVISPLVPPFALHSLMVQRQLLASTAGPPQLYRHPSRGSSYGELLHHGLYPLSALNPQSAFGPSQLSSIHPSTKL